ncbi:MAG TPA: hypothetical protein VFZ61_17925 [Polyangiales bacterium]
MITGSYCAQDGCDDDSHCGPGERCTCTSYVKRCVPSQCRADTDCQPGQRCVTSSRCGDFVDGFYCTTRADTCASDADCSGQPESTCAYVEEQQRWRCQPACIVDVLD